MCMCKRINMLLLGHIWISVYSLGILMVIRVGNSIILLQEKQLFLKEQSLMNVNMLGSHSVQQPQETRNEMNETHTEQCYIPIPAIQVEADDDDDSIQVPLQEQQEQQPQEEEQPQEEQGVQPEAEAD